MVTILRQPVAKMLRHLTRKTLFLPKHRIKSHISKIKQLPSPSPIFNVVLRKFQHDLLLWPTLRREGRGGLKREDLIGTLDVHIRYNVSSLFATGCTTLFRPISMDDASVPEKNLIQDDLSTWFRLDRWSVCLPSFLIHWRITRLA